MYRKIGITIMCCAMLTACGDKTYPGKTIITINGDKITEGYMDFLGSVNPRIKAQLSNPMGRKQIIDNIIEQELFYQAAVKKGLDHDPQVKEKADLYRRVIVAQSYVEKQLEDDAKKYYADHQSDFEKLRMSQIFIPIKSADSSNAKSPKGVKTPPAPKGHSDAEALALAKKARAEITTSEDFAKVAKEYSEDPITKANGGDLGEVSKTEQRMVRRGYEPLLDKAFSMKVGEVSEPIKTSDGYHIIVVTRGVEVEPFDSAKQGIMFRLQSDIRNKLLADLKKDAKITFADEKDAPKAAAPFGASPPPPPPAQTPTPTPDKK